MKLRQDKREKGVSEAIGFTLIVAVVLFSITIIFFGGLPILEINKDYNQLDSAKHNMELFYDEQENLLDEYQIGSRHNFQLQGSSLSLSPRLNSMSLDGENYTGILQYNNDQGLVEYEFGALIEANDDFSVMLQNPSWTFTDNNIFLEIPNYQIKNESSISGRSETIINTRVTNITTKSYTSKTVDLVVQTRNEAAWRSYFDSISQEVNSVSYDSSASSPKITISNYNNLYIKKVNIKISLSS